MSMPLHNFTIRQTSQDLVEDQTPLSRVCSSTHGGLAIWPSDYPFFTDMVAFAYTTCHVQIW